MDNVDFVTRRKTFFRQVRVLTVANLKSRYRKTMAGMLWVVINPLIMYGVQSQIFKKILKLNVPNYYLFLASGLLPWIFLVHSLEMGTPILQWNGQLLKSYPASPLVYLISQIVDNFINFLIAFTIILIPLSFMEKVSGWGILFLPVPLLFLVIGTTGMVWLLATLQVFFRDTKFILSFTLGVAYFMTPIFYPASYIPDNLRWIIKVNPLYNLIAPFRVCIYSFDFAQFISALIPAVGVSLFFMIFAYIFWLRKKHDVYFYL